MAKIVKRQIWFTATSAADVSGKSRQGKKPRHEDVEAAPAIVFVKS
jgi:hypothetical protein